MTIFISYSRKDESTVKALAQGLEAAHKDFWFDVALGGGDIWWDSILENIRRSTVFLFAVSNESLQSRPCLTELDYAVALNRPILPVQVGPVDSVRLSPLALRQIVPYRADEALTAFEVVAAIEDAGTRVEALPDPLPAEPPIPFGYLLAIGKQIDGGELSLQQQLAVVDQLRRALADETDDSVQQDIVKTLKKLQRQPWAAQKANREIDRVLQENSPLPPGENPTSGDVGGSPPVVESPAEGAPATAAPEARVDFGAAEPYRGTFEPVEEWSPPEPSYWEMNAAKRGNPNQPGSAEPPPPPEVPFAARPGPFAEAQTMAPPPNESRPAPPAQPQQPSYFAGVRQPPTYQQPPGPQYSPPSVQQFPPQFGWQEGAGPRAVPPSAFWVLSIIALVPAVFPGCIALYFSYQVGECLRLGDMVGARKASAIAKAWGIVGVSILGLALLIGVTSL